MNLNFADLRGGKLCGANFSGADLGEANLSGADLIDANFSGADLSGADLFNANLRATILSDANLSDANLIGAILSDANHLREANFAQALFGATTLGAVDFRTAKGLETAGHQGPSTIGIDTVFASGGEIPEVFLRGAGVPDTFIAYMRSLVGTAIEFYSCFISYSSKDQKFAERLYADLQAKGVRCWFAPEDMKIGDKFRNRIDEAIRVHEKLLIVLSSKSIRSTWVEKEVETAFEREAREKKIVLFPIRVDGAVMKTDQAWAADIRRTRHIGDFSRWKDHDAYTKAFERLMRDLRAADKAKSEPPV